MKRRSGVEPGATEFKSVYVINCVINSINVKSWSDEFNAQYTMFFLGRANCHVFRGKLLDLEICFNLNIQSFKKISMILKSNCRNNQSKKSILKGILHGNTPSAFLSMQYKMTVLVWQNSIFDESTFCLSQHLERRIHVCSNFKKTSLDTL